MEEQRGVAIGTGNMSQVVSGLIYTDHGMQALLVLALPDCHSVQLVNSSWIMDHTLVPESLQLLSFSPVFSI